jgi:inhibitor of KinA sporulation pathway (predicted exonuclease)
VIDQLLQNLAEPGAAERITKNEKDLETLKKRGIAHITSLYTTQKLVYAPFSSIEEMSSKSVEFVDRITARAMNQVLDRYGMEEQGTWKRSLHDGGSSTVEILIDNEVRYDVEKVRVLVFDSDMRLWSLENNKITFTG